MAHNFFIGDLGFHKCVNDDHPYERATAPFRKEQFDAAATVGDQSLTGWWTRGQLSFHRGAGVKYYEVLDGEEVLDRFQDSLEVAPSVGETRLHYGLVPYFSGPLWAGGSWADGYETTSGGGVAFLASNRLFYGAVGSTPTEVTTNAGAAVSARDRRSVFYCTVTGSSIYRLTPSSGATSQLYTHSSRFDAIFYEKDRLWVVDATGNLYQLSTTPSAPPVAVGSGDLVAPLGRTGTEWSMTSGPASVYLAGGSTVYEITLNDDGTVPTVTAPRIVATLPEGETVAFLRAHLGSLVIGTNRGVRVGALTNGGLVYGGLHDVGECGSTTCVEDTSVWFVAGDSAGTSYLTRIDLAQPITDLTYGWVRRTDMALSGSVGALSVLGSVGYWRAGAMETDILTEAGLTDYSTSGHLTTGYHRLGTLDDKHFHEVLVRCTGSGGSVEVHRVDADGTETQLLTSTGASSVTAAEGEATFPLGLTAPTERIALKFTLNKGGASQTPVLLGYQLKALPSPRRQRLVRVPLMMFDVERGPTGRALGRERDAWTRLTALEDLEMSDALVTFEDKDTGETGTAYIESVEMLVRNGPKGNARSNGFGGIVNVTLRKVGS